MELNQQIQTATEKIWNESEAFKVYTETDERIILGLMRMAYIEGMRREIKNTHDFFNEF
jgi:hypothetical protein